MKKSTLVLFFLLFTAECISSSNDDISSERKMQRKERVLINGYNFDICSLLTHNIPDERWESLKLKPSKNPSTLNGYGKEIYDMENRYEGNYTNGKRDGKGTYYFEERATTVDETNHETSIYWNQTIIIKGFFKNDDERKTTTTLYPNGVSPENVCYVSEYDEGNVEQNYRITFRDGSSLEGIFEEELMLESDFTNRFNGTGIATYANGSKYIGGFKNSLFHGKGIFYFATKTTISGDFSIKDAQSEPTITLKYRDNIKFEGSFKNGKRHGVGVLYTKSGAIYKVKWVNDKKHGQEEVVYTDGKRKLINWVNGIRVD